MADYEATVHSPKPHDEVFDYLARFEHVQEWDPSIGDARRTDGDGPPVVGARYHVVVDGGPGSTELDYEVLELDAPRMIKLRGESGGMVSVDTITVEATGDGCSVTYAAKLELAGIRKLADPLLQIVFNRMGDKARDGLAEKIGG